MHHDLDIGTIPRDTNLCLCAHQLGSSRSHSCVADHEPHAPPHSTSVLTTCVNRMHRHHDSPMISRVPRSHYCFFPKTASIIGTFLVATTTSLTGNASFGVLVHRRPARRGAGLPAAAEGPDARKRFAEPSATVNQVLPSHRTASLDIGMQPNQTSALGHAERESASTVQSNHAHVGCPGMPENRRVDATDTRMDHSWNRTGCRWRHPAMIATTPSPISSANRQRR